ncbi:MAG TPA: hypothetical protein VFV50_19045 [Bdellovibrionales bacterium]|nr:hypothetical protein [Bdellovibrionales bacterium]
MQYAVKSEKAKRAWRFWHRQPKSGERGAIGWAFLWLIGIPVPILLLLFVARGCT